MGINSFTQYLRISLPCDSWLLLSSGRSHPSATSYDYTMCVDPPTWPQRLLPFQPEAKRSVVLLLSSCLILHHVHVNSKAYVRSWCLERSVLCAVAREGRRSVWLTSTNTGPNVAGPLSERTTEAAPLKFGQEERLPCFCTFSMGLFRLLLDWSDDHTVDTA